MDTLPRFRLPDESSSHDLMDPSRRSGMLDVSSTARTPRIVPEALSSDFDDLDELVTCVRERTPVRRAQRAESGRGELEGSPLERDTTEKDFDALPTKVRPALGKLVLAHASERPREAKPREAKPRSTGPRTRRELDLRKAKNDAQVEDVVEELRAAAAGRAPRVRELPSTELLPDASEEIVDVDVGDLMFDRPVATREVWNIYQAAPRPPQVTALIEPRSSSRFVFTAAVATLIGALLAIAAAFIAWRMAGLSF